jgi:predicted nucleic acid-binding protein
MSGPEPEPCFIDTNIWLYALIEDDDPGKSARAKLLIETRSAVIVSMQVINEVCVNLIKGATLRAASAAIDRVILREVSCGGVEQTALVEGLGLTGAICLLFLGQPHRVERTVR